MKYVLQIQDLDSIIKKILQIRDLETEVNARSEELESVETGYRSEVGMANMMMIIIIIMIMMIIDLRLEEYLAI